MLQIRAGVGGWEEGRGELKDILAERSSQHLIVFECAPTVTSEQKDLAGREGLKQSSENQETLSPGTLSSRPNLNTVPEMFL